MRDLPISRRDVQHALNYARSVTARAGASESRGVTGTLMRQGTSGAAAFGYGVLQGHFGEIQVGPVSADLLSAVLLNVMGFTGFAGNAAPHVHNVAQGLMDGYLHRMGVGLGDKMRNPAAAPAPAPKVAAAGVRRSFAGTNPMTQAEIATMGQAQFAGRR